MRMLRQFTVRVRELLSDPQRQAIAYSAMGVLGLVFAMIGIYLLLGGGGDGDSQASPVETASPTVTATATATRTPTRTPTPSPTPTKTPAATPTPTATATAPAGVLSGGSSSPPPTAVPTATPTAPPIVAGGPYCPGTSGPAGGPPVRVFGLLKIAGVDVPAGTNVSLAFDGVSGPAKFTSDAGGYAIDYAQGGSDCANRQGAAITVIVNGRAFPTGYKVGDGAAGFIRFDIIAP